MYRIQTYNPIHSKYIKDDNEDIQNEAKHLENIIKNLNIYNNKSNYNESLEKENIKLKKDIQLLKEENNKLKKLLNI